MPFVRIEILSGKTPEYKKTLLQAVHDAFVAVFEVEADDRGCTSWMRIALNEERQKPTALP